MPGDPFYSTPKWRALRREAVAAAGGCCAICGQPGNRVDHIVSRRAGGPDTLANLRVLCGPHDAQVKENSAGQRRRGGRFGGCDAQGNPLDAAHWWRQPTMRENLSHGGAQDRPGASFSVSSSSRRGRAV